MNLGIVLSSGASDNLKNFIRQLVFENCSVHFSEGSGDEGPGSVRLHICGNREPKVYSTHARTKNFQTCSTYWRLLWNTPRIIDCTTEPNPTSLDWNKCWSAKSDMRELNPSIMSNCKFVSDGNGCRLRGWLQRIFIRWIWSRRMILLWCSVQLFHFVLRYCNYSWAAFLSPHTGRMYKRNVQTLFWHIPRVWNLRICSE